MFQKTIRMKFCTQIECDTASLYDFHIDTNNLPKITPPYLKVKITSFTPPLYEGSEISLDITRFKFSQPWRMKIAKLTPHQLVCDKAMQSPFASFIHYHRFEALNDTTSLLCDELEFSLPMYPFSHLVLPFIKHEMRKMFTYRHQHTKTILEKQNV